ncbi:MAG: hypothetical protein Q7T18_01215 [Sedimentisphaerales bacterium]|nr:hypothetical protein [Sedimentisphaerales bacterium]
MMDFKLKKVAVPEVVLLAILLTGFAISYGIVWSRSDIKLSPPNEVPASGFWFSMPQGGGWQKSSAFKFSKNGYYLTSAQDADGQKSANHLTVAYLLAAGKVDANDWFRSKAVQMGGRVSSIRYIKGHDTDVCVARIEMRGQSLNIFYGIATLPGERNVIIEVVNVTDDAEWGWDIVTRVAESFDYKGNPLLDRGKKIIASIRSKGLEKLLGTSRQEDYFLLGEDGRTEGFAVNMYARTGDDAKKDVRIVNSSYLHSLGGRENILQTDDRFDTFLWLSNTLNAAGVRKRLAEVRLDEDASMRVRLQGSFYAETYVPGPAAIPELLAPAVFREMLASGTQEAIVDFIDFDGRIVPAAIRLKRRTEDSNDGLAYTVTVHYFGEGDISEEIFLDVDGKIEKGYVLGQTPYTLQRSGKDVIFGEFPLWLDYLTSLEKLLMDDNAEGKKPRRIVHNVTTAL